MLKFWAKQESGLTAVQLKWDQPVLLQFINMSHLAAIFLSHLQPLMDSLSVRHISFSLFMLISFEIVHTCVYIQNTDAYELLG